MKNVIILLTVIGMVSITQSFAYNGRFRALTFSARRSMARFKPSMEPGRLNYQYKLHKSHANSTDEVIEQPRSWYPYGTLAILVSAFTCNQWSRQILFYLCDFSSNGDSFKNINVSVGFNQGEYATLASLGFTFVFASFSLIAGTVADSISRRKILSFSCFSWSIATMLQGLATRYSHLLPLRSFLGASQAFYNPAAYTLLADLFPKSKLATVNGIFSSGIYLGGSLASLSILLSAAIGWRETMFATGLVGVVVALLAYTFIRDPKDDIVLIEKEMTKSEDIDLVTVLKDFTSSLKEVVEPKGAKLLFAASALRFFAGFTVVVWKAPFIFSKFQGIDSLFAESNAAVVAVGGIFSSLAGGLLADYLNNNYRLPKIWIPAIGSFIAAPLWIAFINAKSPIEALLYLLGEYVAAECWFGPTLASLFQVVPSNRRGAAQGLFSLLTAVGNLGPILVASLTGNQYLSLDTALSGSVSISLLLSGFLFTIMALEEGKSIEAKE